MSLITRVHAAARVALLHFLASVLVGLLLAWLVFSLWFPGSLRELANGVDLFLILLVVDVVCGPVLSFVLFDPAKSKKKWMLDLGLIVLIQLAALTYGMNQMASARPVFVAFEGDRFRIVQAIDINADRLIEAPTELRSMSYTGPQIISVRLARPGDTDYLASVQMSLQGLHPSFRPSRWQNYDSEVPEVLSQLKSIDNLRAKNPDKVRELNAVLTGLDLNEAQLGYMPLVRDVVTDWVVLIERPSGAPLAYLNLDGW